MNTTLATQHILQKWNNEYNAYSTPDPKYTGYLAYIGAYRNSLCHDLEVAFSIFCYLYDAFTHLEALTEANEQNEQVLEQIARILDYWVTDQRHKRIVWR